jgi:hypothetical protein
MGMTASFVALSNAKLNELKADAEGLPEFFFEHIESGSPETVLDIDKSWQGIHFLLTGEPYGGEEPYSLPVLGGVEIGEDLSYGPARYLEPLGVQTAAAALAKVSIADLRNRYIPAKLEAAEVYPTGIWESEGDGAFEYLAPWYEALQKFYALAAARGDAMLLAIL